MIGESCCLSSQAPAFTVMMTALAVGRVVMGTSRSGRSHRAATRTLARLTSWLGVKLGAKLGATWPAVGGTGMGSGAGSRGYPQMSWKGSALM